MHFQGSKLAQTHQAKPTSIFHCIFHCEIHVKKKDKCDRTKLLQAATKANLAFPQLRGAHGPHIPQLRETHSPQLRSEVADEFMTVWHVKDCQPSWRVTPPQLPW